jgi:predicted nucleotidyltransferase
MFPFEQLFKALNEAGVRYVVVGGVAVVLHGHMRYTGDLDLVIDLSPAEARKAMETMTRAEFTPRVPVRATDFANADLRQSWIDEKNMIVFSMLDRDQPPNVVDFFVKYPVDFDALWQRSIVVPIETTTVRIASIDDLITMKRAAGRAKDLLDIEELENIRRS